MQPRALTGRALERPQQVFLLAVAAVVVVRVVWSISAWDPGFSALFADDFDRVRLALIWEQDPYLLPPEPLLWLPLQSWILGFAYLITGSLFSADPMALAAIVNVAAMLGAAALVGWTAWMIFDNRWAGLVAATVVLFSPWAYFTSLSGLVEPLYFLTVAATVGAYVAWVRSGSLPALYAGGLAAMLAATARYEGWWLAVAWGALVGWQLLRHRELNRATLPALILPGIFPLVWLIGGQVVHDDPLFFSSIVSNTADRLALGPAATYYPNALLEAAPVILVLGLGAAWMLRANPLVRALTTVVALHFALFYVGSLATNGRGLMPERFVFAFAVGLAPLVGGTVMVLKLLQTHMFRVATGIALTVIVALAFGVRTMNDPQVEEWSPAEDAIAAARFIGESYSGERIHLEAQQAQFFTSLLGNRVRLIGDDAAEGPVAKTGTLPIQDLVAGTSIGTWQVTGLEEPEPAATCPGCDGWSFTDESAETIDLPASPYLPLRFGGDNPRPGDVATIWRAVTRQVEDQKAHVELRAINGHGIQTGRVLVRVAIDGHVIFEDDIRNENRWYTVDFEIPGGSGESIVEVSLIAQPGIERRANWGRSRVLVRTLEIDG